MSPEEERDQTYTDEDQRRRALLDQPPEGWVVEFEPEDRPPLWRFRLCRQSDGLEISGHIQHGTSTHQLDKYTIELQGIFTKRPKVRYNWSSTNAPSVKATASLARPKWLQRAVARLLPELEIWHGLTEQQYKEHNQYEERRAAVVTETAQLLHYAFTPYNSSAETERIHGCTKAGTGVTASSFSATDMRLELSDITPESC